MTDAIKTISASPFDNLSALRLDQSYVDAVGVNLKIAFRDRIVDRADHPLVQRLLGIM
jgi:hypothetical protein